MNETTAAPIAALKTPWWRRTWVVAVAAGMLGLTAGAAVGSSDPRTSSAYTQLASKYDGAKSDLASTKAELAEVAGDIPDREKAVASKEAELDAREAAVKASEASVLRREKKVGLVEAQVAANTISGDGVYKVGPEMKPGTYKTSGGPDCYYAVLNSTDTSDIATNNLPGGPAFVTVQAGKYFESTRCGDWVLQR